MQTQTFPHTLNKGIPTGVFRDTEGRCPCIQADCPKHLDTHLSIMFLNIQIQFYSTYCPVIQSKSYKFVQVESKSLFYSFPYGLPSSLRSSLPGHFCHPLLWPHPGTALSWDWHHSPAFSHCLHSLSTQSTSRPWTVPFQPVRAPPGHISFPILASTPVSSHLPFLLHLMTKPHPGPPSSSASSPPAHWLRSHIHVGATKHSEFLISSPNTSSPFFHPSLLARLSFSPVTG